MADTKSKKSSKNDKNQEKALLECQRERDEYLEGWKRAKASAINEKKLSLKNIENSKKNTLSNFVAEILPTIDSINVALSSGSESENKGILQIKSQLEKNLNSLGISIINPLKESFNPHEHESMGEKEAKKEDDNKVIEVLRVGAKVDDVLIRPATVYIGNYKNKK